MDARRLAQLTVIALALAGVARGASVEDKCKEGEDPLGCLKYKALRLMDDAVRQESIHVMDGVKLVKTKEGASRTERSFNEGLEDILETHEIQMELAGTKVTVSPDQQNDGKINVSIDTSSSAVEGKGKKSKLRKLLVPLMVFVLLKAMTLIPLALGVLGLKAWNALQLSFFSFVTSLALAIFNLCKKIASDQSVPVAHAIADPYHYAARNLILPQAEDAQELAYSAYEQQQLLNEH
ncbi:Osiris 19 [Nesidiocoris tenuis]|uniref:Osiris 19 n=1 Tax=Nesidiocoris tenuis TaxID=355587 RepID=A0ABN7AYP3_9HEMI|nr:Osiris 19 [Nesidiocoris tenuis]